MQKEQEEVGRIEAERLDCIVAVVAAAGSVAAAGYIAADTVVAAGKKEKLAAAVLAGMFVVAESKAEYRVGAGKHWKYRGKEWWAVDL